MYNGIGLQTVRGSGTNGHVQRNFAFVSEGKKNNIHYRTEEDIAKLDARSNRQPNLEILDHERKRKIELKCAELEEVLETQGFTEEEIQAKVDAYRIRLNCGTQKGSETPATDESGRPILRGTHEIAEAQQQKKARLREAFGISDYFVDGTSLDPERKAREDLSKSEALQKEIQLEKNTDRVNRKRYALVRTPSLDEPEPTVVDDSQSEEEKVEKKKKKHKKEKKEKRKKKKRSRDDD